MSSQAPDRVYVIGMGEVGSRLAGALQSAGVEVRPVSRESGWDDARHDRHGLRLVCVREEALPHVLDRLGAVPAEQITLIQNGWIRPVLEGRGDVTRGLIWFTSKGEFFRELRPSPFCGPSAPGLVRALRTGGLEVSAVSSEEFASLEADKMGFNCVVGLPLAVHRVSLAEYLGEHRAEAEALFAESVTVCATALGRPVDPGWWPAFLAAVEPLGWVRTDRAKALELRNGAIVELARDLGMDAPVNRRLIAALGEQ